MFSCYCTLLLICAIANFQRSVVAVFIEFQMRSMTTRSGLISICQ